jgi:hypothetical protein
MEGISLSFGYSNQLAGSNDRIMIRAGAIAFAMIFQLVLCFIKAVPRLFIWSGTR